MAMPKISERIHILDDHLDDFILLFTKLCSLFSGPFLVRTPLHFLLAFAQSDAKGRSSANVGALPDEDEGNDTHDSAQTAE